MGKLARGLYDLDLARDLLRPVVDRAVPDAAVRRAQHASVRRGRARHRSRRADHGPHGRQADLDDGDFGRHFRRWNVGLSGRPSLDRAAVEADGNAVLGFVLINPGLSASWVRADVALAGG